MTKGIILTDSCGNWIGVSENFMKHQVSKNRNMFWADNPEQVYHQGDWVELAFWPATNGEHNPESQEYEFTPWTWQDGGNVTVFRHFYHNLSLPWETPMYGFSSAVGDEKDETRIAAWVDLDGFKIPVYDI